MLSVRASVVVPIVLIAACSSESTNPADAKTPDRHTTPDLKSVADAKTDVPTSPDLDQGYRVAAIQYGRGDYLNASGCTDDLCAIKHYVGEAAKSGAKLVLTPQYPLRSVAEAASAADIDPSPAIGDNPATDSKWKSTSLLKAQAQLAIDNKITLVFDSITKDETNALHETAIAVDPSGKVIARHYKYLLYAMELSLLTPGASVDASTFTTPAGKAGILVGADVHCINTNMKETADCPASALDLTTKLLAQSPAILLFPAWWTVANTGNWGVYGVAQKIAKDTNAWVLCANVTALPGRGGGIWKPDGNAVEAIVPEKPTIVYATIPIK